MDRLDMSLDEIAKQKRAEQKKEVRSEAPKTVQRKTTTVGGPSRRGRRTVRQEPYATAIVCRTCGGTGHMARDCPSGTRRPLVVGMCYACGGNHKKVDCPHRDKVCDNCGERGHLRSTCRKPPACFVCGSTAHGKLDCPHRDKVCDLCGKTGHLKATCRQETGEVKAPPHPGASGVFGDVVCDNCRRSGHVKRNCPDPARCFRCSSTDHVSFDCPHKDKVCDHCGKVGHLKAMCRAA